MDMQELVITSDLANLPRVLDFVRAHCIAAGLSDDAVFACELATDEACTNVIEHAYGGAGGEIRISCSRNDDRFVVRVHDRGQPFNPAEVAAPALSGTLSEREIGGLGLHFMRSLMDEVRFEFDQDDGNTLTMVKRVG
jgi:serine/threonine-protein kinase RsbW